MFNILILLATRKKLQRVNICVSPKGIEMFDFATNETLMQVSIYKISYCSADAAHNNVFAFVGSDDITSTKVDEQLVCYVFLCQKRKIAQKVTLTVAQSFEQAYQIWRDATERKQFQLERQRYHINQRVANCEEESGSTRRSTHSSNDIRSLLIDFSSEITAEICSKDHRDLLQNTWVSFEDGTEMQHSSSTNNINNANSLWENNLINCA